MSSPKRMGAFLAAALILLVGAMSLGFAEDAKPTKARLDGWITKNDGNAITVRDADGKTTVVNLTDETNVKAKDPGMGLIMKGKSHAAEALVAGLEVNVWGTVDASGTVTASKIEFSKKDMSRAQAIQAGVADVQGRTTAVEKQAAANKQSAAAAQRSAETAGASAAAAGQSAAAASKQAAENKQRLNDITKMDAKQTATVNFELNSATLSAEAKTALDGIASAAASTAGSLVEIRGYTDATGKSEYNSALSKKRAQAVSDYLVQHDIPTRRIVMPAGYGEAKPVADNATEEGRAENRRVEVRLMVSKGLQPTN